MTRHWLPVAAAALLALAACSDSNSPPPVDDTADDIRGIVLDADGQPVTGVAIMLQHEFADMPGSAADKPQTGVGFILSEDGPIRAWLTGFCADDTVRVLIDGPGMAGEYRIFWDGLDSLDRLMPDGVYRWHVVTAGNSLDVPFVRSRLGYSDVPPGTPVAAQATTDSNGAFRLTPDCLPFGHEFTITDELGDPIGRQVVTRRVRVWVLFGSSAPVHSDWTTIDADLGADVTIMLDL